MHPIDKIRLAPALAVMLGLAIVGLLELLSLLSHVRWVASEPVVIPPIETAASSPWLIPIVVTGAILLPLTCWIDRWDIPEKKQ